jgi:hypothetical protein
MQVNMETKNPLSSFFSAIEKDGRISCTHIGVYVSLVYCRVKYSCANPIQVFSHEVMELAKISSPTTYFKCINDLNDYGYIIYKRSYNRKAASKIYFLE